jgi:hypothetical protein
MSEFGKVAVLMGRVRLGGAQRPVREDEAAVHCHCAGLRGGGDA